MKSDKIEVIKPKKEEKDVGNLVTPVIYLIIGFILAFKSNEAVTLLFYVIGILVIVYGLKSLMTYYQNKENGEVKNINLTIGVASILLGIFIMALSKSLELSVRYIIGFFLIYLGVSRFLTSLGTKKFFDTISNLILVLLGAISIFSTNIILVIVGWFLIINAIVLFWEYLKK